MNLTGLQTAEAGLRYGSGTQPNVNYAVPRAPDVQWLATNGFTRSRLPIQWEMLQPMLYDTNASAAARTAIGVPGAFNAGYESLITHILDAHASAGIKCILDLHNYGRYRDFIFQSDGSVIGLVRPASPQIYAYSSDANQVQTRIFATAPGATLRQAHFADFWTRAANKWKNHPGFGGYGLMNEPYNMPAPGTIVESSGGNEDKMIWPTFARAAIDAIRAVDPAGPIYLSSNEWSAAFLIDKSTPAWPITGTNLIYEVHTYLDAGSSGQRFDWDAEVARGFSAGIGNVPIDLDTGVKRLKIAVDWAAQHNIKLALTETGMPLDDARWQECFQRMVDYARANNVDVYSWNGGNYWPLHDNGINHVPGFHQNKTLEPPMSSAMKKSANIRIATVFDAGPGYALAGTPVTITVYARGYLASPATLAVLSNNGGTLSSATITLPAGANSQTSYTFTPASNRVTTLTYTVVTGGVNAPPARKVFSVTDPVALSSTNLADAALAIIAKYGACKWDMADGYTDYLQGAPAAAGQVVRAVSDSGWGSSEGNAMHMLNWMNQEVPATAGFPPPVMRVVGGKKCADHSVPGTAGLWCRKTLPNGDAQPHPRNRAPYDMVDSHFTIAAVSVPGAVNNGVVFQASNAGQAFASQLTLSNSRPQLMITDETGTAVTLTAPTALAANTPAVLALTSVPGAQRLRVNSTVVGSAAATFSGSLVDQLLIGWGYQEYYPREGFGGNVYAVVTGKGAPSTAELGVIERYLLSIAVA